MLDCSADGYRIVAAFAEHDVDGGEAHETLKVEAPSDEHNHIIRGHFDLHTDLYCRLVVALRLSVRLPLLTTAVWSV